MTIFLTVLLALVGVYLLLMGLVTWFSLKPMRLVQWFSPGMVGLPQVDVTITTADGVRLSGWFSDAGQNKTVVAVHGYMMNRCEFAPYAQLFADEGWSLLVFDLRAQGKSGGKRVGLGCDEKADVEAAVAWAAARGDRVVLFGSSMGGVACTLAAAAQPEVEAMILDGAYASLDEAIDGWWEFVGFRGLSKWLYPVKWAGAWVVGIRPKTVLLRRALVDFAGRPALLMYGDNDPLVGMERISELSDGLPEHQVLVFPGSTHGQARLDHGPAYRDALRGFLIELDASPRL
ncbi:MAG: alpha/beta fold hydrolase [Armatimonadetes bacterium]|nr:alpha/beta fold hydrolase [Armatimonadota bacterium]